MPQAALTTAARRTATAGAAVLLLTAAVYARGIPAGFVGDDFMILHRLRALSDMRAALGFFHGEFFDYYRPLPFLLHAMDWFLAGYSPSQFHLTNLLLHLANTTLVMLITRQLAPRSNLASLFAGVLFGLHAANHEAVLWMSARFDLLATFFALAAICAALRSRSDWSIAAPILFFAALLSKESVVALPVAAIAIPIFLNDERPVAAVLKTLSWLTALGAYALLRHVAGGIEAAGGAGRLPKIAALTGMLVVIAALGDGRAERVRAWFAGRRAFVLSLAAVCVVLAGAAAALGFGFVRDKLAVAAFDLFNTGSPVIDFSSMPFYLDPRATWYWAGGVIALAAALVVAGWLWTRLVVDRRMWFLAACLVATLIPISALTEGTRYLYLPSAVIAVAAGVLLAESRARTLVAAVVAVYLLVSAVQTWKKAGDWVWAGRLTDQGARLVDASLAPSCGEGNVIFLTEPVALRGVYTHFLYETFEPPRGCMPAVFQVLVRAVRVDVPFDVKWDGPSRIVISAPSAAGLLLSRDLRQFDVEFNGRPLTVETPVGTVEATAASGMDHVVVTLTPGARRSSPLFFYYSRGAMHFLPSS